MNGTVLATAALCVLLGLGVAARADVGAADLVGLARPDGQPDRPDVSTMARLSTLRVAGRTCDGLMTGSGFHADGVVLTVAHLVADAFDAKVDGPAAPIFSPVMRRSASLDLVTLAPVAGAELVLAADDPVIGETVFLAGHDGGRRTELREAVVHLVIPGQPYDVAGIAVLIDGRATEGFSGGPVLDERGEVVGIIQGYEPTLGLTVAISVSTVRAWLDGGSDGPRPTGGCP